jgi:hypothetical protein
MSKAIAIALGLTVVIVLIAVNIKKKEKPTEYKYDPNNLSLGNEKKPEPKPMPYESAPQKVLDVTVSPEIMALANFDEMVQFCAPDNLNEKEMKFFAKWFRKFHLNSAYKVAKYMEHVEKGYSPLWRDNLFAFSMGRSAGRPSLQTEDEVRDYNARNMFESAEFILDELKLYDTPYTKKGELRSQVANGKGYLEKAIYDFRIENPKAYKMYITHIEKFYKDEVDKIPECIARAIEFSQNLSKTDSDWFTKKLKKYQHTEAFQELMKNVDLPQES